MQYDIEKNTWHICKICKKQIKELAKIYGGCGVYYPEVFEKHLLIDHQQSSDLYFTIICNLEQPVCSCGICNKPSYIQKSGSKLQWRKLVCGRNKGVLDWSEKAKTERKGKGNPMYRKTPWNNGLTKENSEVMKRTSDKMTGRKASDEQKRKMSEAASKRTIHGHTGHKHSEENKEKFRQNTLKMIKEGKYRQTKSLPHIKLGKILDELGIPYEEEVVVGYFTFDYYLINNNTYIEVDGDYFHSNPKIYPDGPVTKTQKINWYRDIKKNKFCQDKNLPLIRFWECDILTKPEEIKDILCNLKK